MKPVNPENQYKVKLQKIGKYRYASTQPRVVDEDTKEVHYTRIHWGTVDENNTFHPNLNYKYAAPEEREKLVFPSDWDLSEIEKSPQMPIQHQETMIEQQDENKLYGDIWLLDNIANKVGIKDDLLTVFSGNKEKVNDILTIAYYLIVGKGDTLNQLSSWQRVTKTPSVSYLTSVNITRLTQSISNQHRIDLFALRADRLDKDELCAVDSTTRPTYGDSLADIKWGKSKDHLPLPQTTEVVVYSLTTHMPLYYRSFPGNIPDSRSLKTILFELKNAKYKDLILITDRGYDSLKNLEECIRLNQKMIMGAKVKQKLILDVIKGYGTFELHPDSMELNVEDKLYFQQFLLDSHVFGEKSGLKKTDKLRLNLYFDPIRRTHELFNLDILKKEQEISLTAIQKDKIPLDSDKSLEKWYSLYTLDYDKETRILHSFTLNETKLKEGKKQAGFFANITHGLDMTSIEANFHYLLRDEQEKYFTDMKSKLTFNRVRCWSEGGKDGREFILFVAQTLLSHLKYIHRTYLKNQFDSTIDILNEMRAIRYIAHPNTNPFITPFISKQLEIASAFGFEVPKGCGTEHTVRKTNREKTGSTQKNKTAEK